MKERRVFFVVESGADVRLIEGLSEEFSLRILARRIPGGVEISHPPSTPVEIEVGPASRLRFALLLLRRLLGSSKEDFVLVQGYGIAALAANIAGRIRRRPTAMLVCSPAEAYYECRRQHPQEGKRFRRVELLGLQVLARLNRLVGQRYIALSRYLAAMAGNARVDIVPVYGVDTARFAPTSESKEELRRRLGLPEAGQIIFFSSRVAPEKDSETLLQAFRALLDEGRDVWLLHRSGGYASFLRDAARFGVGDRIVAGDAVHPNGQLADDYRACDVCVQASRAEGLGFSVLEALACGTPVVAAATGGLRETILQGETGWSYPVGDVAALRASLVEVLDDQEEARRRAMRGRDKVVAEFRREHVFDALRAVVSDAVSPAPSAFD